MAETMCAKARSLLNQEGVIVAPCAYDAMSARLIEKAGFKLIGTSGHCMHYAMLGMPDVGLIAYNEMLDALSKMCDAVQTPIICDAEGGYGNAINTIRTVRTFEKAGLAGLFLEDQELPTNCPSVKKPNLLSTKEMIGKIHAAVDARKDEDFIIVARTDALKCGASFEEACERANLYLEAGADMVKPVLKSPEQLVAFPKQVKGPIHLAFNANGKNNGMTVEDVYRLGYKIVTFPLAGLLARAQAEITIYQKIMETGSWDALVESGLMYDKWEWMRLMGQDDFKELDRKYMVDCE